MRVLLIGANGQLGSDIVKNNPDHELISPQKHDFNITSSENIREMIRGANVDWVVNTAAFHNVMKCEEQPELAFALNCTAVKNLAQACQEQDVQFMTFSTDYVFGGEKRVPYTEEDDPRPLQIYGISKLAGELAALAVAPEHVTVVRTCGLYGTSGAASKGGNFVDSRVADGRRGGVLEVSSEQVVCPTSTDDLSKAVHALIGNRVRASGVYHLVNRGECSWFEFTGAIFDQLGMSIELRPVDRGGRTGVVRRPAYSVLSNKKAHSLGIELPTWQDALKRYLQAKHSTALNPGH